MKVIQLLGYASGGASPVDGQYVVDYDPTWINDVTRDSAGWALMVKTLRTTLDINKAKKFADAGDALLYWKMQSPNRPLRPDGKPNRPLTAFTAEIKDAPQ